MNMRKLIKKCKKIAAKGKIKFCGKVIDLTPLVESSAEEATIVSSLDKIIPVVSDRKITDGFIATETSNYKGLEFILKNDLRFRSDQKFTLCMMRPTQLYKSYFYDAKDINGALMRQSTLPLILEKIGQKWKNELFKAEPDSSAVLYIPDVCIFLNKKGGIIKPVMVNVLFTAFVDNKDWYDPTEHDSKEEYKGVVTAAITTKLMDVFDAAINLGVQNIYFNPYMCRLTKHNTNIAANVLARIEASKKVSEAFNVVGLAFDDDHEWIEFCNARKKNVTDDITIEDYKDYLYRKNKKKYGNNPEDDPESDIVVEYSYVKKDTDEEEKSDTEKEVEKRKVLNAIDKASKEEDEE